MNKKDKPNFNVPNDGFMKSVKSRWRKPRGVDSKKRIRRKPFGKSPKVGYKNSELIRGNHPSGKKEVYIRNPSEFDAIVGALIKGKDNVIDFVVRVAAGIGRRKRIDIEKKAGEHKIHILNKLNKKAGKTKKERREEKENAKKLKEKQEKEKQQKEKQEKEKQQKEKENAKKLKEKQEKESQKKKEDKKPEAKAKGEMIKKESSKEKQQKEKQEKENPSPQKVENNLDRGKPNINNSNNTK